MGIRKTKLTNKAFFMNLAWRIWKQQNNLYVSLLKSKYFPSDDTIWTAKSKSLDNIIWKSIICARYTLFSTTLGAMVGLLEVCL